jgi:hypothetical protein
MEGESEWREGGSERALCHNTVKVILRLSSFTVVGDPRGNNLKVSVKVR